MTDDLGRLDPDAIRDAYRNGKLKKAIAADYGLTIAQVKRITGTARQPRRTTLALSIDDGLLKRLRRDAARNGRLLSREVEHVLREALSDPATDPS